MVQGTQNNLTTLYDESGTDIYGRQFIKQSSLDHMIYWPSGGFVHSESVYLFWNSYEQDASLPLGVSFSGMVIAELDIETLELLEITPLDDPSLEYGMAVLNDETAWFHYVYGRKSEGVFRQVYLARCPLGEIFGDWEFFTLGFLQPK